MCCFSRPIQSVSQTNIFARSVLEGRQYVVYSMILQAREGLAMILPIPVKQGTGERAVRFVNLEDYPEFFSDMHLAFPEWRAGGRSRGMGGTKDALEVVSVGSFEASYVPTVADFDRLDARFRLPAGTWQQLPQYKSYGFAVFKLKPGAQRIHPMAFEFPRANPKRLFFPTVHIHDGRVHATAMFDHALFCQPTDQDAFSLKEWRESERLADSYVKVDRDQSLVIPKAHLYFRRLAGRMANQDTWIG